LEDKIVKIENYEIGAQTEDDNGVDEGSRRKHVVD
jgi:hypothetical protein